MTTLVNVESNETTTTTNTVSLVSLEKALIAIKHSYDKANSVSINLDTEEGVKAKAIKDAKLVAQENIVLAMIKNNHTVALNTKGYYDLVLERVDVSKAEEFPVLDHEGKVLDFLYTVNKEMHVSSGIVVRFWNMTKRVLSLSWYYTGRYIVNGLVYTWNKLCDLWSWIKSKFTKDVDATPVATETSVSVTTEEATSVASEEVVIEIATPVATPVIEETVEASEPVVEGTVEPIVEEAVTEVSSAEIPVVSEELLEEVEEDLITTEEELDVYILGDVEVSDSVEIVVATQNNEVSPLEIFEVIEEVSAADDVDSVAEVTVAVAPVVTVANVADESMPTALAVGAPAVKAPNTKVKVSRPGVKTKSTKAKKS